MTIAKFSDNDNYDGNGQIVPKINEIVDSVNAMSTGGASNLYTSLSYDWSDEWFIGAQLTVTAGWNNATYGATPYALILVGANSAVTQVTGSGRLGVASFDTGTTNTGESGAWSEVSVSNVSGQTSSQSYEAVVGFPTLSTVGEEFLATIGLVGTAPGYGVWLEYDRANAKGVNPSNLNCWQFCTMENGTATRTLLSSNTIAAAVFVNTGIYRVKVVMDYANNQARAYVDGTLVATHTTNLPTHSLGGKVDITKSAGTTSRSMYVDYTNWNVTLNSARLP